MKLCTFLHVACIPRGCVAGFFPPASPVANNAFVCLFLFSLLKRGLVH